MLKRPLLFPQRNRNSLRIRSITKGEEILIKSENSSLRHLRHPPIELWIFQEVNHCHFCLVFNPQVDTGLPQRNLIVLDPSHLGPSRVNIFRSSLPTCKHNVRRNNAYKKTTPCFVLLRELCISTTVVVAMG